MCLSRLAPGSCFLYSWPPVPVYSLLFCGTEPVWTSCELLEISEEARCEGIGSLPGHLTKTAHTSQALLDTVVDKK